ncbi:hypothetical protein AXF42_Ash019338 [Apostasia shenzhenica]|uniref:Uncharacterized protein n=1 Tax=Apostasia shenzhenica TaxID=1088818 RepID=A0A2H9ZTI1_9ASPA|nr:hypothetical protein AXF42_Ash019338 [Apostasia shenzhenica]
MVAVVDVTDSPDRPSQRAEVRTEVRIVRQTSAEMVELEGALLQAAERSQVGFKTVLGELKKLEDRLASLASSSSEWAGRAEAARGEYHRTILDIGQAHSVHIKDIQKRIKELNDEKEALRWEREKFKKEAVDAKEAESKAKQAAFEDHHGNELLKAEMHSMCVLVENNAGWRGRHMEDLEEAVRKAVNIIGASPVGHHVKS